MPRSRRRTAHRRARDPLIVADKAVVGVRFDTAGPRRVRVRNGVVLATGGFEWDEELRRAFLRGPITHPVSIKTNTDDGLKMAMTAGGMIYGGPGGTLGPGMTFGYLAGRHAAGRRANRAGAGEAVAAG